MKRIFQSGLILAAALTMALPVFAQTGATAEPAARQASGRGSDRNSRVVDTACMQRAATRRDDAIIASFRSFSTLAIAELETRRAAVGQAWTIADRDARRDALQVAGERYRSAVADGRRALRDSRRTAWGTYRTDRRNCRVSASEDRASASLDNNL